MTPYEINILLHYYCRADDWAGPGVGNPHYKETIEGFVTEGLLENSSSSVRRYDATEKLHAYCEALQQVPLPVQQWVMPK